MDSQKQQAADRIKEANNILVTVSANPSVDQLAACIGLTLSLNKMGKHATAVFSGAVPSTIEFLQPEKTLEKNTDSLRDFIIALDKSKADKLRYKVEDKVVKIFITPYKTSISEKDLEFSQGDFNVDVVLALGVHNQADLDQAITSHGRILHDATVVTVNVRPGGELGGINWLDPNASSLSELGAQLIDVLDKKLIDGQIATALLTGIVAETERFSNAKTTPQTMSVSAELMAAGANQQLVATKLEEPAPAAQPAPIPQEGEKKEGEAEPPKPDDGTLEISHEEKQAQEGEGKPEAVAPAPEEQPAEAPKPEEAEQPAPSEEHHEEQPRPEPEQPAPVPTPLPPAPAAEEPKPVAPQIHIDEHGALTPLEALLPPKQSEPPTISHHNEPPKMIIQPPIPGGAEENPAGMPSFGGPGELPSITPPDLPSAPANNVPGGPVGHTIMPPSESAPHGEEEVPSGGASPSDSFLVGNGSMPVMPPTPPAGTAPGMPGLTPPAPMQPQAAPAPQAAEPTMASLPATNADAGRTLHDIEEDVHSLHLADEATAQPPVGNEPPAMHDNMLPPMPATEPMLPQPPAPALPDMEAPAPASSVAEPAPETPATGSDVNSARDAVAQAINGAGPQQLDPLQALNAQPVDLPMGHTDDAASVAPAPVATPPAQPWTPPEPQASVSPAPASTQFNPAALNIEAETDPNAPPEVPPPMLPPANPY